MGLIIIEEEGWYIGSDGYPCSKAHYEAEKVIAENKKVPMIFSPGVFVPGKNPLNQLFTNPDTDGSND